VCPLERQTRCCEFHDRPELDGGNKERHSSECLSLFHNYLQTVVYVQVTAAEQRFFGESATQVPEQQSAFGPTGVLQELLVALGLQPLLTHLPPQHCSPV
jgi:hypothetical protein